MDAGPLEITLDRQQQQMNLDHITDFHAYPGGATLVLASWKTPKKSKKDEKKTGETCITFAGLAAFLVFFGFFCGFLTWQK